MRTERTNDNYVSTMGSNSTSFEIAQENQAFIIEALSKNIYRDPIGTIVREYCSNAWDANVEAGVDEPIIVNLDEDATGLFFSVVDFGSGMSEEKVKNVFVKYGKSTKGGSNSEIGGFGIGAKSAFAYSDTFFVNTVSEGTLYRYMVSKTNKNPEMTLILEEKVDAPSGTEIKIYLRSSYDWSTFENKIKRQLLHFDNVILKKKGEIDDFFTEKKTFDHQIFQVKDCSSNFFDKAYALVGPVAYPIDYSIINERVFEVPLGIKFNIGELDVTLSREELRYTDETIQAIKNKLEILREAVEIHNSKRSWWCKTPEEFYEKGHMKSKLIFGDILLNAPKSIVEKNKNFRYKVMGVHPDFFYPFENLPFLKIHAIWNGIETKRNSDVTERSVTYKMIFEEEKSITYLLDENVVSTAKMKWLSNQNPGKNIILVKNANLKYKQYKMMDRKSNNILDQQSAMLVLNGSYTQRIIGFKKKIERPIINKIPKISEVVVPQYFIEQIKTVNTLGVIKGMEFNDIERPFGNSYRKTRIDGNQFKLTRDDIWSLKDLIVIYTNNIDDVEVINKMKAIKNANLLKVFLSKKINYRSEKEVRYKRIFLLHSDKPKQLEALKNSDFAYTLEEAIALIKPTNSMKKECLIKWYRGNLNCEMSNFLRRFGLLKKQEELSNKVPKLDDGWYGLDSNLSAEKKAWFEIFGEHFSNVVIPEEWLHQLKIVQRYKKTFKEFKILKHDLVIPESYKRGANFTDEQILLEEIYRKRGVLPSINSQSAIFDWEKELIIQSENRKKYLQSLV